MGKFFSEQSQPGLDNFDTESLNRDDFDNYHEMRGSYVEEFKQPLEYVAIAEPPFTRAGERNVL